MSESTNYLQNFQSSSATQIWEASPNVSMGIFRVLFFVLTQNLSIWYLMLRGPVNMLLNIASIIIGFEIPQLPVSSYILENWGPIDIGLLGICTIWVISSIIAILFLGWNRVLRKFQHVSMAIFDLTFDGLRRNRVHSGVIEMENRDRVYRNLLALENARTTTKPTPKFQPSIEAYDWVRTFVLVAFIIVCKTGYSPSVPLIVRICLVCLFSSAVFDFFDDIVDYVQSPSWMQSVQLQIAVVQRLSILAAHGLLDTILFAILFREMMPPGDRVVFLANLTCVYIFDLYRHGNLAFFRRLFQRNRRTVVASALLLAFVAALRTFILSTDRPIVTAILTFTLGSLAYLAFSARTQLPREVQDALTLPFIGIVMLLGSLILAESHLKENAGSLSRGIFNYTSTSVSDSPTNFVGSVETVLFGSESSTTSSGSHKFISSVESVLFGSESKSPSSRGQTPSTSEKAPRSKKTKTPTSKKNSKSKEKSANRGYWWKPVKSTADSVLDHLTSAAGTIPEPSKSKKAELLQDLGSSIAETVESILAPLASATTTTVTSEETTKSKKAERLWGWGASVAESVSRRESSEAAAAKSKKAEQWWNSGKSIVESVLAPVDSETTSTATSEEMTKSKKAEKLWGKGKSIVESVLAPTTAETIGQLSTSVLESKTNALKSAITSKATSISKKANGWFSWPTPTAESVLAPSKPGPTTTSGKNTTPSSVKDEETSSSTTSSKSKKIRSSKTSSKKAPSKKATPSGKSTKSSETPTTESETKEQEKTSSEESSPSEGSTPSGNAATTKRPKSGRRPTGKKGVQPSIAKALLRNAFQSIGSVYSQGQKLFFGTFDLLGIGLKRSFKPLGSIFGQATKATAGKHCPSDGSCKSSVAATLAALAALFGTTFVAHLTIQTIRTAAPGLSGIVGSILLWQPVLWLSIFSMGYFMPFPFGWIVDQLGLYWNTNRFFFFFLLIAGFKFLKGFVHIFSFYFYTNPAQPPSNPTVTPKDVTVIISTVGNFGADLSATMRSILVNQPSRLIIATVGSQAVKDAHKLIGTIPYQLVGRTKISVDMTLQANKRAQFISAASKSTDDIICYCDDHVVWPETLLKSALAPFEDKHVGLVGTVKAVERVRGQGAIVSMLNYIGCIYLERHNFECTSTYNIDGGVFVISGRTGFIRRQILADYDFRYGFLNERFEFGPLQSQLMKPDDDNYMTRYCVKNGWKTVFHNHPDACIGTTIGIDGKGGAGKLDKMQGQLIRWARSTWRSNLVSLFHDRRCWKDYPWTTYAMFISSFVNLAIIYDPLMLGLLWFSGPASAYFCGFLAVLMLSKCVKPIQFLLREPSDLWMLPFGIFFGYLHSVFRLYALFTITSVEWSGRKI